MRNEVALDTLRPADRWVTALVEVIAVAGAVWLGSLVKVPLPFSPVPVTLQTFSVLLVAYAVAPGRATAGMLLYLALGMAGLPVLATPFGPTFGYLLGFAAAPCVVSRVRQPAWGILTATLLIYAMGASWLSLWLGVSFAKAVLVGVIPFIPGDFLKALAAYNLIAWARR